MAQTCKRTPQLVILLAATTLIVACDSEKSTNPLSPSIAGPLAGITISSPTPVQPINGQLVAVDGGSLTLTFQTAVSDSPRPFWHEAQIADDGVFGSILHTYEEIRSGEGDLVSFQLPQTLDPERTYYWRTRAVDGANTGPYSNGASFEIYTPVTIGAPTLALPSDGATTQTATPLLSVNNATLTGPASDIIYRFEIATAPSFSPLTDLLSVPLEAGQRTSVTPGALGDNMTYYWRVRVRATGRTGEVVGPVSEIRSFRTPPPLVVIGMPVPFSPDNGATTSASRPAYLINNGTVSGPAGSVTYQVEVATDVGFTAVVDSPSRVRADGTQTSIPAQVDLAADTVFYWRARGTNGILTTAWSQSAVFRTPSSGGGGGGGAGDELNLSEVNWLHTNVSNWAVTSNVINVTVTSHQVCVYHTAAGRWPTSTSVFGDGAAIEGNVWIFAFVNGRWHAATWDWLRPNQQCKSVTAREFGEDQIRISPLDSSWTPRRGDTVGFMMSTIARSSERAGEQRSNVVLVTWPY